MNVDGLRAILDGVAGGQVTVDEAMGRLDRLPFEDIGFARVDHHRSLRVGAPEVIFGSGKSAEQVIDIATRIVEQGSNVLVTRTDYPTYELLRMRLVDAVFHEAARVITVNRNPCDKVGRVAVVTAGTSDIGVAEEAAITAESTGSSVERIFDVGVAGLHRLLGERDRIASSNAVVVIAGMEGALPSVVGGLVAAPVIAVPTSIGYGAAFGGVAALLGMLTSCASNVTVVNIDNGFGAGYVASLINRNIEKAKQTA